MKLKHRERTFFEKNPIREVIAQIRFPRNMEIESGLPATFQKEVSKDFPLLEIQRGHAVSFKIGNNPEGDKIIREQEAPVFNFSSEDKKLRISLTSSFIALTSVSYESWDEFYPRLRDAFKILSKIYSLPLITRVGVRYRNLIDREELGLSDMKWEDLISPKVIGHLANEDLFEGSIETASLMSSNSITQVRLDEFSLTLQTGFAEKDNKICFYIDADHYNEFKPNQAKINLDKEFEVLHGKSSSVFGNCINDRLFKALKPIPKS